MKKLFTLFCLLSFSVASYAQVHWTELIQDPNANYFKVKAAFEAEWKDKPRQKGMGYSIYKRWEHDMLKRMDANGDPRKDPLLPRTSSSLRTEGATGNWVKMGPTYSPGPTGYNNDAIGRVCDIAFHPSDTNTFYIAAATGGVWKTTNNGSSYTYLSALWPSNYMARIQINNNNPNELWATLHQNYLMHSTDGGSTWSTVSIPSNVYFPKEAVFNYAEGLLLLISGGSANYYSNDNGASWTAISGLPSAQELVISASDSKVVYASNTTNLFKSTDGGKTFVQLAAAGVMFGSTRNRIAVSAAEPNSLWLLAIKNSTLDGVYKSTDNGASFSSIMTASTTVYWDASHTNSSTASSYFGQQGFLHGAIAVSPINTSQIFIAGVGIFRTENGGTLWEGSDSGWPQQSTHVDHLNVRYQPITNRPFSCDDGGVYKALKEKDSNGDFIWKPLNENLGITQMYKIAVSNTGNHILTGQQDNGSFLYDKVSDTWDFMVIGDGTSNGIDPSNEKKMYVANQYGSLYYSDAGGRPFDQILSSTGLPESSNFYSVLQLHPTQSGVVYHLRKNLWKSSDYGKNWQNLTSSLNVDFSSGDFSMSYNNTNVMSVYASFGNAYLSEDGGVTWNALNRPLNNTAYCDGIYHHSTNANIIWMSCYGAVYQSTDKGVTWTQYSWPSLTVNEIVHIDGTTDAILIATTQGVYIKENGSNTLSLLNSTMPVIEVKDIQVSYCTGELYAATFGLGAWKIPLDISALACCKTAPQVVDKMMICSGSQLITTTGGTGTFQWYKDGVKLAETSSSINATASGTYEVFTLNNGCESGHSYSNVINISATNNFPLCVNFEGALEDQIKVLKDWIVPVSLMSTSTCSSKGNKMFAFQTVPDPPFDGRYNEKNDTIAFVLPQVDLTYATSATLSFDVSTLTDASGNVGNGVAIYVSTDCGAHYTQVFNGAESVIALSQSYYAGFAPQSCSDWKSFTVDMNAYKGYSITVKFAIYSPDPGPGQTFFGGNLFLDNICVNGTGVPTAITEESESVGIRLYPNPVFSLLNIQSDSPVREMKLYTSLGQQVFPRMTLSQINMDDVPSGFYVLHVTTDKGKYSYHVRKQ